MGTIAEVAPTLLKRPEIFCFGATAELYVARLQQGLSAVICDGSNAALALAKAVERGRRRLSIPDRAHIY